MPAGSTYSTIATTTLGSAQANIAFSSIPSIYTDLILVMQLKPVSGQAGVFIRYNSDSGSNYSNTFLYGTGSTAASTRNSNTTGVNLGQGGILDAAEWFISTSHIQNYSNTTTNKTTITRNGNAIGGTDAVVSLWRNTGAINAVTITATNGGNLATGSIATLYGIASA